MTTLSLLKNIEEIKSLKIFKLPFPDDHTRHPEADWIKTQFLKWSEQLSSFNLFIDTALVDYVSVGYGTHPPKERLLIVVKGLEISFRIDLYLKRAREERSEEEAKMIVHQLIETLKTGQCDKDFNPGNIAIDK